MNTGRLIMWWIMPDMQIRFSCKALPTSHNKLEASVQTILLNSCQPYYEATNFSSEVTHSAAYVATVVHALIVVVVLLRYFSCK